MSNLKVSSSVSANSVETTPAANVSAKVQTAPKARAKAEAKTEEPKKAEKIVVVRAPRKNTEYGIDLVKAYYYNVGEEVLVVPAKNSKLPQKQFKGVVKSQFEYFKNAVKCYYIEVKVGDEPHTLVKRQSSITDLNPRDFAALDKAYLKKYKGPKTFPEFVQSLIDNKKALNTPEAPTEAGAEE